MMYQSVNNCLSTVADEIIISIRPEHASKLYSGTKVYELRRVIPKVVPRRIYLYETNGDKQITGHIIIERVIAASPEALWKIVGTKGTTRDRFFKYFKDATIAYAFEVSHAVKYRQSFKLEEIRLVEKGFKPPQNFLYLQNLPKLKNYLWDLGMLESINSPVNDLELLPLDHGSRDTFIDMVIKHIDGAYRETGEKYGKKLIEIFNTGIDTEGVFTKGKHIFKIMNEDENIGFVVITKKNGGSVKTGPVLFFENFIAKGFGKMLRQKLHHSLGKAGYRKVYCTVPANNYNAIGYLMASGYRLEAHLERHYHEEHDEFVFGFPISKYRAPGKEFLRQIEPIQKNEPLSGLSDGLVAFIEEEFSAAYCSVNAEWALSQINESIASTKGKGSKFRPRKIYIGRGLDILVVGLCLIKRGGSAKIILLTRTSHQKSLTTFIQYIEKCLRSNPSANIRKIYTHVPVGDNDLMQSFYEAGFKAEGILERPYSDDSDLVAMGKMITTKIIT